MNTANLRRVMKRGTFRRLVIRLRNRPSERHAMVGAADLWAMKRRFQFEFLTKHGLKPGDRLMDMGCGTLRGGIPLIDLLEPGHYVGVESRPEVLDEARKELAEAGLEDKRPVLIQEADPAKVNVDEPVDYLWAFSVLIHFSDEILDACLGMAARVMAPGGRFYANVQIGERNDRRWGKFPWVWRPEEYYREVAARHGLDMSEVGTLKSLGHKTGSPEQDDGVMLCFTHRAAAS